ncbi:hypothetical protein ACFQ1T_12815 [Methylophilus glucosoxydans]|uniref:Uncharacterized protein n=1 Tax=Methylophilus glucosoxydans TaxID=752553 RepID=A0ABW3GJ97_9PROT
MTIDPQISAALIAGFATIAAVVVTWWLNERKNYKKSSVEQETVESDSILPLAKKTDSVSPKVEASKDQLVELTLASISKITVKEIIESINSAPPFQKELIAKQYNGIVVRWIGHLKEAMEDPRDKESVRVSLTINQGTYIGDSFWFTEKMANFPEVRTLKRGSAVRVIGQILDASGPGLCVDLKPIAIEVMENHG